VNNPQILEPVGQVDERVHVLRFDRQDAESLVLVNFGNHADTVGGSKLSADWPGFVRQTVEKALDNTKCIFFNGVQGDVNHINVSPTAGERKGLEYDDSFDGVPRGYAHAKYMGRKVAAAVIAGLDKTEPISCDTIFYQEQTVTIPANKENHRLDEAKEIVKIHAEGRDSELPYEKMELTTVVAEANRICELANGPDEFPFTLGVLKLGDFVMAALPGECFVEIGRRIEATYEGKHMMVCCLTNGGDSYFPTSSAYDEGGYEARTSILKKGGDDIVVAGMKSLMNALKES
jgi:hypothetical protein